MDATLKLTRRLKDLERMASYEACRLHALTDPEEIRKCELDLYEKYGEVQSLLFAIAVVASFDAGHDRLRRVIEANASARRKKAGGKP